MSDPLTRWINTRHKELTKLGFEIEVKTPQPDYDAVATYVSLLTRNGCVSIGCWQNERFDFEVYSYAEDNYTFRDVELKLRTEQEVNGYFRKIYAKHIAPLLT